MTLRAGSCALLLALLPEPHQAPGLTPAASPIAWQEWSEASFERARREGRLVLLDLEAVWCHWCHVMDAAGVARVSGSPRSLDAAANALAR